MPENWPDDGRIGKEIDWSLVVPSITRPVGEPPALEVLDELEDDDMEGFSFNLRDESMSTTLPHLEFRLWYLDLICEILPLDLYNDWVKKTLENAKEVENQEKVDFYEGLVEALKVNLRDLDKEFNQYIRLSNALGMGTPMSDLPSPSDTDNDVSDEIDEVETSEAESTLSRPASNNDTSAHSNAEAVKAINPHSSLIVPAAAGAPPHSSRTNRHPAGIFTTIADKLCCHSGELEDD